MSCDSQIQNIFMLAIFADAESGVSQTTSDPSPFESQALTNISNALADSTVAANVSNWSEYSWSLSNQWSPSVSVGSQSLNGTTYYYVDNLMYLAEGTDPTTQKNIYVIGIAGTNGESYKGWFCEDLDVGTKSYWNQDQPSAGQISSGTRNGLTTLQDLTSNGQTLYQYLQTLFSSQQDPCDIVVTGHSLGGALAPVYAQYLKDNEASWNTQGSEVTISFCAFAGATPGDSQFASYVNNSMGTNNIQLIWNTMDVVPHAWDTTHMEELPTLFNACNFQSAQKNTIITSIISYFTNLSSGQSYSRFADQAYVSLPGQPIILSNSTNYQNEVTKLVAVLGYEYVNNRSFSSSINTITGVSNPLSAEPYLYYLAQFMVEAGLQHVSAYFAMVLNDTTGTFLGYLRSTFFDGQPLVSGQLALNNLITMINQVANSN